MSNSVFDPNIKYAERFVNNHSKKIKFPEFKYYDAKIHPKYRDHVVVLSTNKFPTTLSGPISSEKADATAAKDQVSVNVTNWFPSDFEFLTESTHQEEFKSAIEQVLQEDGIKPKKAKMTKGTKTPDLNKSSAISKTNALLEETKALGLDDDSEEMSGGESDDDDEDEDDAKRTRKVVWFKI